MKTISHSWSNGGDNSKKPIVQLLDNGRVLIVADADTDVDGSPRVGTIDPSSGQSETSLRRSNGWKGAWKYCDSEIIPFYVLPLNWGTVTGIHCEMGDVAKLTFKDKSVYAIFADQGPRSKIGEASLCAIEALGGKPWNSAHTRVVSGISHGVSYEVIPGSADLNRTVDWQSIQAYGEELFGGKCNPAKIPGTVTPVWVDLKQGSSGQRVKDLQTELNTHFDAQLKVDGSFGSKTESAVTTVKIILGYAANGIIDEACWKTILLLQGLKEDITPSPTPAPTPAPSPAGDYSVNFAHLKNVAADLALSAEDGKKLFAAMQAQALDKAAFNARITLGVKPEYGSAQCATTTASVIEGAAIKAGLLTVAALFAKGERDKDLFALTHQIEIELKRLGFRMYAKGTIKAPLGAIAMMSGRYNFGGVTQHSGHVFTMYEDMGVGKHDVICDNGGWAHTYAEMTESFFVPAGVLGGAVEPVPTPTPVPVPTQSNAAKYVEFYKANYDEVRAEVNAWFTGVYSPTPVKNGCVAHVTSCLHLCEMPNPDRKTMAAINVDYFVEWAESQGWSKISDMSKLQPGDICVSGPSQTDIDHVYAFVSYINQSNAYVLHNQKVGLAVRSLVGDGCGRWRFAMRMK